MTDLLNQLELLRAAWLEREPRRAAGGVAALSGFHFQLLSTLRDRVLAWNALPPANRAEPAVFDELLSDALALEPSGRVTITQAKRVLSSDAVAKALDELWSIDCLARRHTPALAAQLAFRIRASRSALADVVGAITRWVPETEAGDALALDAFRSGVAAEILADPLEELLAALANSLNPPDPLGLVRRWLGLLLERIGGGGARDAAREIWSDLRTLQVSAETMPVPGLLQWSGEWVAPATVRSGGYLTGQRPTVLHLREGYFAPRDEVYGAIANQVGEWITASGQARGDTRLPVFWIAGRSGAGKSVALLHVLALLNEGEQGPVLWLGDKIGLLPAALARARTLRIRDCAVIIGVDDPYSPEGHADAAGVWRESLEQIESLRQVSGASEIPRIVCCGPTEHAEHFSAEFPDDIHLTRVEIPQERASDLAHLREWFRLRTGREAPEVGDHNVLLVQVFFEWRVQSTLPEFAARLKNRIRTNGRDGEVVFEFVSLMLALNRLYVGLPSAALEHELNAAQQDLLEFLRQDNHLAENVRDGEAGLWLAHPHLSNAVYESWFPLQKNRAKRRAHLRAGILLALHHGAVPATKTAPLWAILRAILSDLAGNRDVVGRIDPETLPRLLTEVHQDFGVVLGTPLPLWALPVWAALRAGCPAADLVPDPLNQAIAELHRENLNRGSLRLICQVLLSNAAAFSTPQRERIVAAVVSLLARSPEWHDWPSVWLALSVHSSTTTKEAAGSEQLVRIALDWMERYPDHRQIQNVWDRVQSYPGTGRRLADVGSKILTRLLSDSPQSWPYLWQKAWAVEADRTVLERLGRVWLDGSLDNQSSWFYVFIRIWEVADERSSLSTTGITWLKKVDPGEPTWERLWCRLWDAGFFREELEGLGMTWLRSAGSHPYWPYVWIRLWIERQRLDLAEIALDWLWLDGWAHAARHRVLGVFRILEESQSELRNFLRVWLYSANLAHPAWRNVWLVLWDESDPAMAERGIAWLRTAPRDFGWLVWQRLWARTESRAEILSVVAKRLDPLGTSEGKLRARISGIVRMMVARSRQPISLPRIWNRVRKVRGLGRTACLGRGSLETLLGDLDLPGIELTPTPSPGFVYARGVHEPPSDIKQTDFPDRALTVLHEFVRGSPIPVPLPAAAQHVLRVLGSAAVGPAWGGYGTFTNAIRSAADTSLRVSINFAYVYIPGLHICFTKEQAALLRRLAGRDKDRFPIWTLAQYAEYFRALARLLPIKHFAVSYLSKALREALRDRGITGLSRQSLAKIATDLAVAGYDFSAAGLHDPRELVHVFVSILRREANNSDGDVAPDDVDEIRDGILRAIETTDV